MHLKMSSAICFNLDQSKTLSSGNGLKHKTPKTALILMFSKKKISKVFPIHKGHDGPGVTHLCLLHCDSKI